MFGPGGQQVHAAKARQPRRDVHGRGMPSEDVLLSIRRRNPASLGLRHVGAPAVDSDNQAALAEQHRSAPHGVVGHPEVAG
jgi:hypothetical protein